jgi:glyoxylase-like metal-dependent hydrolase (beta-lactamase superfamily II)
MIVEHFAVGALGCICTIAGDPASGEAIVVDGGDDVEVIAGRLAAHGLRATYLVHSHAHFDHIAALGELRERCGGAGLLHPADGPLYALLGAQPAWVGLPASDAAPARLDGELEDGLVLRAGGLELECLHTPGHTPGSTSFALRNDGATRLLTGDTLFRGAIGRWDLGGTSMADIVESIREKLLPFEDPTVVIPGHGPATTIGTERRSNPYLV